MKKIRAAGLIERGTHDLTIKAIRERWRLEAELELLAIDRDRLLGALDDLEHRLRHEIAELSDSQLAKKLDQPKARILAIRRGLELAGLERSA